MRNEDFAGRLARKQNISRAEAADELDGVVHRMLRKLRRGQPAALPGLGIFKPGRKLRFQSEGGARVKRRKKG